MVRDDPYPRARRGLVEVAAVAVLLVATAAAAGVVHLRLAARVDEQQLVVDGQDAQLARMRPFTDADAVALRAERDRITGILAVFDRLQRARHGVAEALDAVFLGRLPPLDPKAGHKLVITSYREQGGAVSVRGSAIDNADISEFMRDLQKNPRFSDVAMPLCVADEAGASLFDVNVSMKVRYDL